MGSYPPGKLVCEVAQYILNKAHVIEGTIESLVAINHATVYLLRLPPALFNSNSCQVGPRSTVPTRLYVDFWSGYQLLHYLAPMDPRIIPEHGQLSGA